MHKPYSESCDQNKVSILSVIQPILAASSDVLEIASGTGQHAIYFASKNPHITWRCSDCSDNLDGINQWLDGSNLSNIIRPFALNVSTSTWPDFFVDAIFTANSMHIMHFEDVNNFFIGAGILLKQGGHLIIYGPFNYNGTFTSSSNKSFNQWLKNNDVKSGIKDFEKMLKLAELNGFILKFDYEMPANNRILHFIKQ